MTNHWLGARGKELAAKPPIPFPPHLLMPVIPNETKCSEESAWFLDFFFEDLCSEESAWFPEFFFEDL